MVTYFNKTDLIKFGEYLFSEERKASIQRRIDDNIDFDNLNPVPLEQTFQTVSHADIENFIEKHRSYK